MCDPISAAKDMVSDSLAKTLQKPVENLLGPLTKELGLTFGELSSVFRFYTHENLLKVFKKWAEQRKDRPINSSDFQRVLPFLQDASLQSDEGLQERWAALLESTVTESRTVLPSFGNTLSQLTAEEAQYVDDLWDFVTKPRTLPHPHVRLRGDDFDFRLMAYVLDPGISEHLKTYWGRKWLKGRLSPKQEEAITRLDKLHLMVQDLERLGILGKRAELASGQSKWIETDTKEVEIPGEPVLNEWTFFTPYGKGFIAAVTPGVLDLDLRT
jgi:hypothetical protein